MMRNTAATSLGSRHLDTAQDKRYLCTTFLESGVLIVVLLCLLLSGCTLGRPSTPPKIYLLNPSTATGTGTKKRGEAIEGRQEAVTSGESLSIPIIVGPVEIPSYLKRPYLVKRSGNQIVVSSKYRWGEPLDEAISRVLSMEINQETKSFRATPISLSAFDASSLARARVLTINCLSFEAIDDARVLLRADWNITDSQGKISLAQGSTTCQVILAKAGWEAIITAMEQALHCLCKDIIQNLERL